MSESDIVFALMMLGLILSVAGILVNIWEMFVTRRAELKHRRAPKSTQLIHHVYLAFIVLGIPLFIVNLVNLILFALLGR